MKKINLLSVLFFLLLCPVFAMAQSSIEAQLHKVSDAKKQKVFIEKVAQQARDKDTAGILAELDSTTLKAAGEANIVHMLEASVFPFFAPYVELARYEQITNATLPDGRAGLWHYTYINSATEKMLPFRIAVIDTDDGPKILDIVVNECVKGRHPICK